MFRFIVLTILLGVTTLGSMEAGVAWGLFQRPSYEREILAFLIVAHVVLYSVITRQLNQRPQTFVKVYLGTTVLRILFFGVLHAAPQFIYFQF